MYRRQLFSGMLAGLLLGICALSAEATPITGSFSLTGNFLPVIGATGAVTSLLNATGIDFIGPSGSTPTPGTDGWFSTTAAEDDFAFLTGNNAGRIKDFTFSGTGSSAFPNSPIYGFETVGGLVFNLLTLDPVVLQTKRFLLLTGTGVFQLANFDPTPGTFDFSGNGAGGTFSFSASQSATPVPEPASLVLLGSGLIVGGGGLRRRWRRSQG